MPPCFGEAFSICFTSQLIFRLHHILKRNFAALQIKKVIQHNWVLMTLMALFQFAWSVCGIILCWWLHQRAFVPTYDYMVVADLHVVFVKFGSNMRVVRNFCCSHIFILRFYTFYGTFINLSWRFSDFKVRL